jgi:NitT/TauT family transport system substrate-binding protein
MLNRREWGMAAAAACWAASASGVRAQPRRALERARLTVAVDRKSALCYLPLTIAERLSYFTVEGLDVQVREYPSLAQAQQAVLGNEAQVLCGPYSALLDMQTRGISLRSLVLLGRAPQVVMGISQRTLANYRGPFDLRGRKIGVMALGSSSHRVARMLVARGRVPDQGVQYLPLPQGDAAVAALRSGQVDALCHADLAITELEQGGDMRVVADLRTVRGNADLFGGPWPSACLSTSPDFASANASQVQALADALVHALKWLQTAGPSDLIKAVPEPYFQGDRALYIAAFSRAREGWTSDGLMPADGPQTVVRALNQLSESGGGMTRVALAQTFTNDFALRAKAKFKA